MKVYAVECGNFAETSVIVGIALSEAMANAIKERSEAAEPYEGHTITEYDTDNYEPLKTKSLWYVKRYLDDNGNWEINCELSNLYNEDINKVSCRLDKHGNPVWYTVHVYAEDEDAAIKLAKDKFAGDPSDFVYMLIRRCKYAIKRRSM